MTYLWIALGGALGSVSRAWISVAMLRITGPQFPWGTVLINVVGSFVIGFFGTLTAADGRFAVPADARAFVMVGVCGGFTTFSSFSLQTLELARDGRSGQALGNVGLSVVCCLVAVAAGHYGAVALNARRARVDAAEGPSVSGAVVAVLDRPGAAPGLLSAAERLAALGGGGRVEALVVRTPPALAITLVDEVLTAEQGAELGVGQEDWAGRLKAVLEDWSARARTRGVEAGWVDAGGDLAQVVTERGKRAKAVVVARPGRQESERARQALRAALFATGGPVLVVPPGEPRSFGRVVAIAWKNDGRAPKAVLGSLPILRRAERLHLLRAAEETESATDVPALFREHGLEAEARVVNARDGSAGERLLAAAHEVGADLLVMGAYAHGEWREAVYSGAKAGVIAMTKAIAKEVGRHGITLNVVCPGFVPGGRETSGEGSMWSGDQGAQFTPEVLEKVARSYPLRRLGTPEDVAPAVLFLASDSAASITGEDLNVSAGTVMY